MESIQALATYIAALQLKSVTTQGTKPPYKAPPRPSVQAHDQVIPPLLLSPSTQSATKGTLTRMETLQLEDSYMSALLTILFFWRRVAQILPQMHHPHPHPTPDRALSTPFMPGLPRASYLHALGTSIRGAVLRDKQTRGWETNCISEICLTGSYLQHSGYTT